MIALALLRHVMATLENGKRKVQMSLNQHSFLPFASFAHLLLHWLRFLIFFSRTGHNRSIDKNAAYQILIRLAFLRVFATLKSCRKVISYHEQEDGTVMHYQDVLEMSCAAM